jgi:Tfp pilus assembly protein PilX
LTPRVVTIVLLVVSIIGVVVAMIVVRQERNRENELAASLT